jgi:hypothetical protein
MGIADHPYLSVRTCPDVSADPSVPKSLAERNQRMAAETEAVSEKAKGFIPKCSPHTGIYSKMTLQNSF